MPLMAVTANHDADGGLTGTRDVLTEQALQQVKQWGALKAHVTVFTLVNGGIWAIWLVISARSHSLWPWPILVTLVWGICLAIKASDIYLRAVIAEHEVERETERPVPH